jgi:carbonic anhydrase
MTVTDQLLENNEKYAANFDGPLPLPPSKHIAVLACMDARLNVYGALGLEEGEAHVIRNAGGVAPTTRSGRSPSASGCSAPRRSC